MVADDQEKQTEESYPLVNARIHCEWKARVCTPKELHNVPQDEISRSQNSLLRKDATSQGPHSIVLYLRMGNALFPLIRPLIIRRKTGFPGV